MKITAGKLKGAIKVPSSKSLSHRAIICAALAKGQSVITEVNICDDVNRTIDGLRVLGAEISVVGTSVIVTGIEKFQSGEINCYESGSTLRFLTPLASMSDEVILSGEPSLMRRPMGIYMNLFPALTYDGRFRMKGKLKGNYYKVQGDISSQFISGLLFVLPLLPHDSVIDVVGPFESKPYVNLTVDMLRKFGIVVQHQGKRFYVKGNQQYKPHNYEVEVDYSALAFYEVANALGSEITYLNNITYSLQGDKKITEIIQRKQSLIDVSDCPDLVPALTVLASFMEGRTEIINASRVRLKESDRLMAITEVLNALGGRVVERADSLVVKQIDRFKGARVSAFNDHRIAMALAIAATRCDGPMEFDNLEVVNKSYKEFWNDFIKLGGKVYE